MFNKNDLLDAIHTKLVKNVGALPKPVWVSDLPGGDINHAALLRSGSTNWFLKYHQNAPDGMFEAEASALTEIADQACIRVPAPIAYGDIDNTAWLVLEHLELSASGSAGLLGEQLAAMHAVTRRYFGWHRDNYIGSTPQYNTRCPEWTGFWRDHRLRPQFDMARAAGHGSRLYAKGENLLENLDKFMDDRQPAASLLHGDLWGGNKAFTPAGQPVIFDPASYYGDRETDIAMTELFGGFEPAFYSAYQACAPLPDGYRLRKELYNLYHLLNHLNLFGSGYLSRCENIIDTLMANVR